MLCSVSKKNERNYSEPKRRTAIKSMTLNNRDNTHEERLCINVCVYVKSNKICSNLKKNIIHQEAEH